MRGRLAIVVALLLPLAGCVGECGPTSEVGFDQPGLFEALAANATMRAPAPGLGALASNVTVESVTRGAFTLWSLPSPRLIVQSVDDDESYRAQARGFLENVSASPEKWSGWIDALVAQRHVARPSLTPGDPRPAGGVDAQELAIDGPFRLGQLAGEIALNLSAAAGPYERPGEAHLDAGGWRFNVQIPVRHLERDGVSLDADPRGRALARLEGGDHAAAQAKIAGVERSMGVSPLPISASDFRTMVC